MAGVENPEILSGYFVVEYFDGEWKYAFHGTSLQLALDHLEMFFPGDYQVRLTTPRVDKPELVKNLEKIFDEHKRGLTTAFEYADRVVESVTRDLHLA